jgi:hypothetical protein
LTLSASVASALVLLEYATHVLHAVQCAPERALVA